MNQETSQQILIESVKILAPIILKQLSRNIKSKSQDKTKVSEAVERHLIEVINWASQIQVFGMSVPNFTDQATISLDLYTEPRRFQKTKDESSSKNESDVLTEPNHILLLGEPGSGKTTTFKRLALSVVKEEPKNDQDIIQYPMVIRLRELNDGESLFIRIMNIFGLVAESRSYYERKQVLDENGRTTIREIPHSQLLVGNEPLENVIPQFLNEGKVLLLLDGLDELKPEYKASIKEEIENLGFRLTTSKIIVSCRSGEYTQPINGFTVLEIRPLTEKQIRAIKNKWLGVHDTVFIERLRNLPYYDVANRPLLLIQLLLLYKRYGYFPDQPSRIYEKLVTLLLEDWDAQRNIKRDSHYAGFDPGKKAEFLSALSYHLTYFLQKTRFSEEDLIKAYKRICNRFNLPTTEAKQVAQEIQTHTGILVSGPEEMYEFCHLSLQEYLCAEYLVRSSLDTLRTDYLAKYSAPLAVAVALSSNPSDWLAALILKFGNLMYFNEDSMASFVSRMLIEHPIFEVSEPLGFAILTLFKHYKHNTKICDYLEKMVSIKAVIESIAIALKWYNLKHSNIVKPLFIDVSLNDKLVKVHRFSLPSEGSFPNSILSELLKFRPELFK